MKTINIVKKTSISLLCIIAFYTNIQAQSFENLLAAGKEDASSYLGAYMQPVFKGLIYNLNGGWYHSGKTHKKLGFDITINAMVSIVPDHDKTFVFNNMDYTVLELQSGATFDELPTVMGQPSTKEISIKIPMDSFGNIIPEGSVALPASYRIASFETLDGIENELPIAAVLSPMFQVGVGLPLKTDLKVRFVPSVGTQDVVFNLFGVGIQHNLLQHFSKLDDLPIFDLSILGAFTTATTIYTPNDSSIGVNQESIIKINTYTAQLVANANFKIVNFYAGLGYAKGTASMQVKGDYTYTYDVQNLSGIPINTVTQTMHDPITIDYDLNGVKATIGARLNIAWFKIFADYSIQEYNTLNAGIAFSFR